MEKYTNDELIRIIKNNMTMLTTNLRNDEASSLIGRLATIRETKELVKKALEMGIKCPEINDTIRLLGFDPNEI